MAFSGRTTNLPTIMLPDSLALVPLAKNEYPSMFNTLESTREDEEKFNSNNRHKVDAILSALKNDRLPSRQHEEIVDSIENVNQIVDEKGTTLLLWATKNKLEKVALQLIQRGALVQVVDDKRCTPLHFACQNNQLALVDQLLLKGASVHARDSENNIPLHYSCSSAFGENRDNLLINVRLLEKNSPVNAINLWGASPLYEACSRQKYESIRELIRAGANPNQLLNIRDKEDKISQTPLEEIEQTPLEKIKEVEKNRPKNKYIYNEIQKQADLFSKTSIVWDKEKKRHQVTPPGLSIKEEYHFDYSKLSTNFKEELSKYTNLEINSMRDDQGNTLLHFAISHRLVSLAQHLVNRGISLNIVNSEGLSPFHFLCAYNLLTSEMSITLFSAMVNRFVDTNAVDNKGRTALHFLCASSLEDSEFQARAVAQLIYGKGRVDPIDNMTEGGRTPLFLAIENKKYNVIRELLNGGADAFLSIHDFETPYQMANFIPDFPNDILNKMEGKRNPKAVLSSQSLTSSSGSTFNLALDVLRPKMSEDYWKTLSPDETNLIEILKNQKNQPLFIDNYGNTRLHKAAIENHIEVMEYLIDERKELDINAKNKMGQTPLHLVCKHGHYEFFKGLLEKASNNLDFLSKDNEGNTLLHALCGNNLKDTPGEIEIVKVLVRDYPSLVNSKNNYEETPAYLASQGQKYKIFNFLINNGANMDVLTVEGDSPRDSSYRNHTPKKILTKLSNSPKTSPRGLLLTSPRSIEYQTITNASQYYRLLPIPLADMDNVQTSPRIDNKENDKTPSPRNDSRKGSSRTPTPNNNPTKENAQTSLTKTTVTRRKSSGTKTHRLVPHLPVRNQVTTPRDDSPTLISSQTVSSPTISSPKLISSQTVPSPTISSPKLISSQTASVIEITNNEYFDGLEGAEDLFSDGSKDDGTDENSKKRLVKMYLSQKKDLSILSVKIRMFAI